MTHVTKNRIEFQKKTLFGMERLYPVCRKAIAVCDMLGAKTFMRHNLQYLTAIGFDVLIKGDEAEEIKHDDKE